jgi:hypothetical protein
MKEVKFDVSKNAIIGDEKQIINCFLEYKSKRTDKSLVDLLASMQTNFKTWARLIKNDLYYEDFTIYSLCRFLNADDRPEGPVHKKLKIYKQFLKENEITIYDDIVFLFLEFLSKDTIDINYFKPKFFKRFLYHVAMEMKYLMFKRIRTVNQVYKRDALCYKTKKFDKIAIALIDTYDYSNLVNTDVLTLYEQYFLTLVQYGFTFSERMALMHNTRKQQTIEEKELWDLLKKKLSDN